MHTYSKGFSLIELTVVLVLVSLLGSLVLPGLANAYASVSVKSELERMQLRLGALGYEAFSNGASIRIVTEEDARERLNPPEGWKVIIVEPLEVKQTGVCLTGELVFIKGDFQQSVRTDPPYCWRQS